jgi:hypothetical protein
MRNGNTLFPMHRPDLKDGATKYGVSQNKPKRFRSLLYSVTLPFRGRALWNNRISHYLQRQGEASHRRDIRPLTIGLVFDVSLIDIMGDAIAPTMSLWEHKKGSVWVNHTLPLS